MVFKPRDLNFRLRSSEAEEVSGLEGKIDLYVETIAKDCSRKISM